MTENNPEKKTKRPSIKSEILKAAEEEFLKKNYRLASVDEIVEKAGVTKRTFYKYFPSKLALFIHVFEAHLARLEKELSKKTRAASVRKEIEQHYRKLFRFTQKNEKFMYLYWIMDSNEFEGEIPQELTSRVQRLTKEMFNTAENLFDRARASGEIIDVDTLLLAHLLSAVNKGIFIHASKEKRFDIAKINPSDLFNVLFAIMEQGLFTKPPGGKNQ